MRTFESGGFWARKPKNPEIFYQLRALQAAINVELDQIHDEALAKFRSLAKSTGQRTRVDRIHRSTGIGY